jgi:hypothetical protein
VPIDLFPWSVIFPLAIWQWLRREKSEPRLLETGSQHWFSNGRGTDEARYALLWFGASFVVLSLMRFKRADYLVPAYPGAAWALGLWLERRCHVAKPAVARWGLAILGAGLIVYAAGWQLFEKWEAGNQSVQRIAESIRQRTDGMVIFFRAEDHALAFHVGRPLDTILEWENLDWWVCQPTPVYFVMPPACAQSLTDHLQEGRLEVIEPYNLGSRRPLVLLRNTPQNP